MEGAGPAAASPPVQPPPAPLLSLPQSVLTTVLERVVAVQNPGAVLRLALTCRAMHRAVAAAEGLWQRLAVKQGWSLEGQPGNPHLDRLWFEFYSRRMLLRRSVRRFLRLYERFLSRPSSMALRPGASPQELEACEGRLGVALPWEVWELLRCRNGQDAGAFVTFADDMRLLALDELRVEHSAGMLAELQQRLQAMGVAPQPQPSRPGAGSAVNSDGACTSTPRGAAPGNGTAAAGGGAPLAHGTCGARGATACETAGDAVGATVDDDRLVAIAANPSRSRRFVVGLGGGQVFIMRGLSIAYYAPSVSAMLQKLLG